MAESGTFSKGILQFGFIAGLVLAFICFLGSAYYLHQFQQAASQSVAVVLESAQQGDLADANINLMQFSLSAHVFVAQVLLRSCGVFAGLAFGFLGFSLFLIGVQGNIDADVDVSGQLKVNLLRLSPGALVLVVSAILIGICSVSSVPGSLSQTRTTTAAPAMADETADETVEAADEEDESLYGVDTRTMEELEAAEGNNPGG